MRSVMPDNLAPSVNPFMGNYMTSDGGTINLVHRQSDRLHPRRVRAPRPRRVADDPRFQRSSAADRECHGRSPTDAATIGGKPFDYWHAST